MRIAAAACRIFDWLEAGWEAPRTRRAIGAWLVTLFVVALIVIEMRRRDWLPAALHHVVPTNHLTAVSAIFSLLLVIEVAGLVFALARSVASSLGKQFELLALILIREAFIQFGHAGEPIVWRGVAASVPHALADMAGALIVFALLVPYYRIQRHRAITAHGGEQESFVCAKKVVSMFLLGTFVVLGASWLVRWLTGDAPEMFFPTFYTVLVLSDVLIVLISLRYTTTFDVVFRNAAFAAATILIRLALGAPPYVSVAVSTGAVLFALVTSMVYNAWRDPGAPPAPVRSE